MSSAHLYDVLKGLSMDMSVILWKIINKLENPMNILQLNSKRVFYEEPMPKNLCLLSKIFKLNETRFDCTIKILSFRIVDLIL